jgi:hypothetical protein
MLAFQIGDEQAEVMVYGYFALWAAWARGLSLWRRNGVFDSKLGTLGSHDELGFNSYRVPNNCSSLGKNACEV